MEMMGKICMLSSKSVLFYTINFDQKNQEFKMEKNVSVG